MHSVVVEAREQEAPTGREVFTHRVSFSLKLKQKHPCEIMNLLFHDSLFSVSGKTNKKHVDAFEFTI